MSTFKTRYLPTLTVVLTICVLALLAGFFLPAASSKVQAKSADMAAQTTIGSITNFSASGNTYTISAGTAQVRVIFYKHDIFRIWLAPNGSFTDPAGADLVVSNNFPAITTTWSDAGTYYKMESDLVVLRANKSPFTFALYKKDNATLIWQEAAPLSWTTTDTTQTLERGANEHFYGGGMVNGFFSHRDTVISIAKDGNWTTGGHPNPVPFYMSTAGYGVFRNTYNTGYYDFTSAGVKTTHKEVRFDAYYFYAPKLQDALNGFTTITGKAPLAPMWGLELGNADCWNTSSATYQGTHNKPGKTTTTDVIAFAQAFRDNDMPGGWFLPNDGYGCGYSDMQTVVSELNNRGFFTGLWTQSGLASCPTEVGTYGTRGIKTDVAWVGSGYKFALDGVKQAAGCIETNSNARPYTWTVASWAGTQHYSGVWVGDQYGNWENIRFQIPTIIGSGLSGQNYAGSDVDGIYAGSNKTYTRDLQWKSFISMFMTMSGWASPQEDKEPYQYPEPYKSYNRTILKLRERLLPYFYTASREAYDTGTPLVRAMVLEFPNDPVTWDTTTQYQFMSGPSLLVAPVYQDSTVRNGIYLPTGSKWIGYWNGTVYNGGQTLNNFPAPMDQIPLFVKAGAIIPMWPQMLHFRQLPKDPITFDIYPSGDSSYTLYEDDNLTRNYQTGEFAKQTITSSAPANGVGTTTITVGASIGTFTGKQTSRRYLLDVHSTYSPSSVLYNGAALTQYTSQAALDAASDGWFFDTAYRSGVVHVKTVAVSTDSSFTVALTFGLAPTPTLAPTNTPTATATQTPIPVIGPITSVRFYPRGNWASRMLGGKIQGSNTSSTSGYVDLATITTAPSNSAWTTLNFANTTTYRYVRYLAPVAGWGNVAEIEFYTGASKLNGIGFGTAGSYNNAGNTFDMALDGDINTAFDGPTADGVYVGRDSGVTSGSTPVPTVTPTVTNTPSLSLVNSVRFYPRTTWGSRMLNGKIQGSNTSPTSGFVDLATITTTPPNGAWTTLNFTNTTAYRYIRYLAPVGGWGNIAELEFYANGVRLTGTGFGTAGSYNNAGNTFNMALDGIVTTAFDGPTADGVYVGITLP